MKGAEVLDEYLDGLLQAVAGTPAATPAQGQPSAAPAFATDPPPAAGATAAVAADVIAEMLADPAFGETTAVTAATTDRIAAELIAEMDADPAFRRPDPTEPAPDPMIAALLAEMDADPAFTETPAPGTDVLAELAADPVFAETAGKPAAAANAPGNRETAAGMQMIHPDRSAQRSAPASARPARPAQVLPRHIQALFRPAEHDHAQHLPAVERSSRWLRLRCGEQTYALELLKVREVVLPTPLLRLRGAARSMLGIMNLRGLVVPVLDLGVYIGAEPVRIDPSTRVVVLEENGETIGLRVSAVEDVATLTDQQIEPPDNTRLCRISNQLFRGVARLGQRPMILLDATQLLH
ncbi:MAG: chemotaxis protein CheW [Pseudomonas sp.]